MHRKLKFALLSSVVALVLPAFASDLAILRNGFSLRHERRQVIGTVTRLYTSPDNKSYVDVASDQIDHFEKDETPPPLATAPVAERAPAASQPFAAQKLHQVIGEASDEHLLDADLINSVIRAESGFNPHAVSRKGAQGLMQLMPQTASNLGVRNALDPQANVEGGTRYLRWLLERYHFDLVKALAAYNAGPQRVEKYRGIPPYYETRAYVARIIRDFNRQKLAEQKALAANHSARQRSKSVTVSHAAQSRSSEQPPQSNSSHPAPGLAQDNPSTGLLR